MKFLIEKLLLDLFILHVKTKKILRSAARGKINYYAKSYFPFALGLLIGIWALFIYFY